LPSSAQPGRSARSGIEGIFMSGSLDGKALLPYISMN
jgi:hypothetical protein